MTAVQQHEMPQENDHHTRQAIEREVRRLAPWYYLYDLRGVRTDITPPFDHFGHRTVKLPEQLAPVLLGRSVLDVGCNEGAYSFSAVDRGAREVVGFDCRQANVEKARYVAKVLGRDRVRFEVGSADTWPDEPKYDVVLLCGLLYHLPRPWDTIRKYCGIARESIFVRCVLCPWRFDDGYTPWGEGETIGASEKPGEELSQYPNSMQTLLNEFARNGFEKVYARTQFFGSSRGWRGLFNRLRQPRNKRHVHRSCTLFLRRA